MRIVEIKLSLYISDSIIAEGIDTVEEYINNQLNDDPDFFGYIDQGCINITDGIIPEEIEIE